jgi:hypothetical protein
MKTEQQQQLDQALQALKACQEVLSDIVTMARMAHEAGLEEIVIHNDDDGIMPEIRVAMFNAQLVLEARRLREVCTPTVSQWAAETMGLPLLARRAK